MKKSVKKKSDPPKKPYTAADSSALVGTVKRYGKNITTYQNAPTVKTAGGSFKKGLPQDFMNTMRSQADSIDRNPYTPTYIQREKVKAGSGGGMKSTKSGSKTKPTPMKSTKAPAMKPVGKLTKVTKKVVSKKSSMGKYTK